MIGKICGTGSYLPDYIIDNFKLAESVDTSDEWIQERTGIRQRHIAKNETTSYMASMAALSMTGAIAFKGCGSSAKCAL